VSLTFLDIPTPIEFLDPLVLLPEVKELQAVIMKK
jgi:hypothetical protein